MDDVGGVVSNAAEEVAREAEEMFNKDTARLSGDAPYDL